MELSSPGAIAEPYMQLLPCLLAPILWERPANISPLVRLLCAFLTQAAPQVIAQDKLVSILMEAPRLVSSKKFVAILYLVIQLVICRVAYWAFFKNWWLRKLMITKGSICYKT